MYFRCVCLRIGRLFQRRERVDGLGFSVCIYTDGWWRCENACGGRTEGCEPMTANPPFSAGSQSSSFLRAPETTTYRVFCEIHHVRAKKKARRRVKKTNLRVGLDLEPATAKMALASKREYGRRIVHSYLLLLCIVTNTHANVGVARSAVCVL